MRCWTDAALLTAAILVAWGDEPTIIDRFDAALMLVAEVLPEGLSPGTTYRGYSRAMLTRGAGLLERARTHLCPQVQGRADRPTRRLGFLAFAVDGTKIDCPRTLANEASFGIAGRDGTHPQMNLVCLWHMGMGLPCDWRVGDARTGERELLAQMLDGLPEKALVVADAGFTGYEHLQRIQRGGRFFLVRVGSSVSLLKDLGVYRFQGKDTVYLWPAAAQKKNKRPLVLRLLCVGQVYLITNVLDRRRMTQKKAGELYRLRWQAEVGFRALKQTLGRRKMRCAAPAQARLELNWVMTGLTLLGLLSVTELKRRGVDPLEWSPSASLRVMRRWRRGSVRGAAPDDLAKHLGRCRKDPPRKGSKKARDWPHKKNDPLPVPQRSNEHPSPCNASPTPSLTPAAPQLEFTALHATVWPGNEMGGISVVRGMEAETGLVELLASVHAR